MATIDTSTTLAEIVARRGLAFLEKVVALGIGVHRSRQRRAEPGQVRAAINVANVVGEDEHILVVAVVVLHCDLATEHRVRVLFLHVHDVVVENVLALVQMGYERSDPLVELELLLLLEAIIAERDLQTRIEVRQFTNPFEEGVGVELQFAEDLLIRLERDLRPAFRGRTDDLDRAARLAALTLEMIVLAITVDVRLQPFAQGVNHADADAVQAAGHLVAVAVELAAGMQSREHHLECTDLDVLVHFDGDAPPVVFDRAGAIDLNADQNLRALAGERLIDRVVEHLIDEVVQTADPAVADIHIRAFADGLDTAQDFDAAGIVLMSIHMRPRMRNRCRIVSRQRNEARSAASRNPRRWQPRSRRASACQATWRRSYVAGRPLDRAVAAPGEAGPCIIAVRTYNWPHRPRL